MLAQGCAHPQFRAGLETVRRYPRRVRTVCLRISFAARCGPGMFVCAVKQGDKSLAMTARWRRARMAIDMTCDRPKTRGNQRRKSQCRPCPICAAAKSRRANARSKTLRSAKPRSRKKSTTPRRRERLTHGLHHRNHRTRLHHAAAFLFSASARQATTQSSIFLSLSTLPIPQRSSSPHRRGSVQACGVLR